MRRSPSIPSVAIASETLCPGARAEIAELRAEEELVEQVMSQWHRDFIALMTGVTPGQLSLQKAVGRLARARAVA